MEASQRLPLKITGMALFNVYSNGRADATQLDPTSAPVAGRANAGATFRQTILGLQFDGPKLGIGAKVDGAVLMDFFGGGGPVGGQSFRIRVASLDLAWKNTTVSFRQDKPIIAPRDPDSLAQVGVSPLTGAGNLWLWQPQVRIEQRFSVSESSGFRAQAGVYQMSEAFPDLPPGGRAESVRPAAQGRVEYWHAFDHGRRIELAAGYHRSQTHAFGGSADSHAFTLDWLIRPVSHVDFTGAYFHGQDVAGMGALQQFGVSVAGPGRIIPVRATGGWAQWTLRANQRLSFHAYGGIQSNRGADLPTGAGARNRVFAGNAYYQLGSNIVASFEASRTETWYLGSFSRVNPHYDLALAYLF